MRKLIIVGFAAAFATAAFGQNLVTNGNFASGSSVFDAAPPGWNFQAASSGEDFFTFLTGGPNSGDGYAAFEATAQVDDVVFQSIATTAGHSYTYSLMYRAAGAPQNIDMWWNTSTFITGGGNVYSNTSFPTTGVWLPLSFTVTATGSSTVIGIGGYNTPAAIDVSDISVTPTSAPEPASMAMLGLGAVALIARRRNRK